MKQEVQASSEEKYALDQRNQYHKIALMEI